MDKRILPFVAVALLGGCDKADDTGSTGTDSWCCSNEGWYLDEDEDGFWEDDCDDTDPAVNPGADEVCGDEIDNNCDDQVDEGCDEARVMLPGPLFLLATGCFRTQTNEGWYVDEDGDGYDNGTDCNDADPAIHPDAEEICDDGVDNNCDQIIDCPDDTGDTSDSGDQASAVPVWATPDRRAQWHHRGTPWVVAG
jgi:hypothetical protein